jgi:hypothetical protein
MSVFAEAVGRSAESGAAVGWAVRVRCDVVVGRAGSAGVKQEQRLLALLHTHGARECAGGSWAVIGER